MINIAKVKKSRGNKCIKGKDLSKEIRQLCHRAWKAMNRLVHIKLARLRHERELLEAGGVDPNDYMLDVCSVHFRTKYFSGIADSDAMSIVKLSDSEYEEQFADRLSETPTYVYYMRIDVGPADGKNYNRTYINEIEPFASGKGYIGVMKKCLVEPLTTSTSSILHEVIKSRLDDGDIKFKKVS